MNKDVIYIDVEDDITAIISRVKDSKEKIVALVPPKRVGILQSAVNLRLLSRAADQNGKHLVLISNNSALMALASAAKIPVARNLQSKPEIGEISALEVDNGEDVIDGAQLPIGEHAKTVEPPSSADTAINDTLRSNPLNETPRATPPVAGEALKKPKTKSGIKVPNFNQFRKKLLLIGGGVAILIAFLIWAIFFAPHATIVITARTTDSSANAKVSLASDASTSFSSKSLQTTVKDTKKDTSIDFDATGTKNVGDKATGTMTLTRTGVSDSPTDVPAGTEFTSDGRTFVSTASVTVPRSQIVGTSLDNGSASVNVAAADMGDEYNLSARTYQTGFGGFTARGSDMSGGSKRQIKVVSANDVQKATDQLAQQSSDTIKKQLTDDFNADYVVIDQTFKIDRGSPQASPAVDQEVANGSKAKLTASITYSLSGVDKKDANSFLDDYFKDQLKGTNDQRVYDNGAKKVTFTNVAPSGNGFSANVVATAKIGPKIDDDAIKNAAKGKRYGDIQSNIETIQGVDNVDIKFWPFWVSSAPNDIKKISIVFNLNDSK